MTLRDLWPFGEKQTRTTGAIVLNLNTSMVGGGVWPVRDPKQFAKEGFGANVTVFACITLAMRVAAGVPWVLYRRGTSGKKLSKLMTTPTAAKAWQRGGRHRKAVELSEIDDHPVLRLMERPNPFMTGSELIGAMVGYFLISGNNYTEIVRGGQRPVELWPMRSDRMKVVPDMQDHVRGYIFEEHGQTVPFETDEVLHLRMFNPTDYFYGQSPLEAAARAIDTDNESQLWNYSLLKNKAMPSGAFQTEQVLSDQAYERTKKDIRRTMAGAANAGKSLVLDAGLKWLNFGHSPAEMDWLAGRKLSKQEICSALSTAPELIGDSAQKTYANFNEARKAHMEDRVMPDLDLIRDGLNAMIVPAFGPGLYLDYDRDQIEVLHEEQSALYTRLEQTTFLSVNEKRMAAGYDEVPGGDVVLVPAGYAPLGETEDEAPAPPAFGAADDAPDADDADPDDRVAKAMGAIDAILSQIVPAA